jgi:hypothetical protein
LFQLFATCVVDTGGKFTASVVDTGGKLLPVTPAVPVANLPLVSLILVVHLVNISVNKIKEMTLMLFSGAWEKMIHEAKIL